MLDRCHEHLLSRGFGVLELATLDLDDCEEIGHQVAGELGVGYHEYMGDSIYLWIQEARETRKLVERYSGYNASALQWMKLSKCPAVEGIDLVEDSEPKPPKGERQRRLINEGSLAQARGASGRGRGRGDPGEYS